MPDDFVIDFVISVPKTISELHDSIDIGERRDCGRILGTKPADRFADDRPLEVNRSSKHLASFDEVIRIHLADRILNQSNRINDIELSHFRVTRHTASSDLH